jgi:hypothetical protein
MDDQAAANQLHKRANAWNDRSFDKSAGSGDIPDFNG